MTRISCKNACTIFVALGFILTVASSEAQAQSQEKIEKANSMSTILIVSALVLATVAVIVTVTKGDNKDNEGEKTRQSGKAREEARIRGQAWVEPSVLCHQVNALQTHDTGWVNPSRNNVPASFAEDAVLPQCIDCWRIAHEIE